MISAMSASAIRSEWVGRVIDGRFTLLQWLGGSERSGVFLTELPGPQAQKAAIKLIQADAEDAEACIAGWAASTSLAHPHLMRLFHSGRCWVDDTALIYVVNEYADEVLAEILRERALTPDEAREMLGPVVDTLSWLHGKGFVHGHLKPSNIMAAGDELKLSGDSVSMAGEPGNPYPAQGIYHAPEAVAGIISPSADVWSLGVTLVEVLSQHAPVWDESRDRDPAVPSSIPQPFADIARGCLKADPAGRCTLQGVRARLVAAEPHSEPTVRIEKKTTAKLPVKAMIGAVLVLLAVIAVFAVRSRQAQPQSPVPVAQSEAQQSEAQRQVSAATAAPQQAQETAPVAATAPPPVPDAESQRPEAPVPAGPALQGAVTERVMPDVLPAASRSIQGRVNVRIRVTVDAGGNVSDATIESAGPSRYFAKAALEAARKWKFKPAQLDGQAVSSAWILQFKFTQAGTEVTPVEASR